MNCRHVILAGAHQPLRVGLRAWGTTHRLSHPSFLYAWALAHLPRDGVSSTRRFLRHISPLCVYPDFLTACSPALSVTPEEELTPQRATVKRLVLAPRRLAHSTPSWIQFSQLLRFGMSTGTLARRTPASGVSDTWNCLVIDFVYHRFVPLRGAGGPFTIGDSGHAGYV